MTFSAESPAPAEPAGFEQLMQVAVDLNNSGDHAGALRERFAAYELAQPGSVNAGRAARDIGHSLLALSYDGGTFGRRNVADDGVMAAAYAEHALRTHAEAVQAQAPGADREYRASAGSMGTMLLGWALREEGRGRFSSVAIVDASGYLREATGGPDDQYRVNFIGRYAICEAMFAKGQSTTRYAIREAWRLAPKSESPQLPRTNPDISRPQLALAKVRAAGRAGVASALNRFAPRARVSTEAPDTARRAFARWLALAAI